jgi:hypothetical protein
MDTRTSGLTSSPAERSPSSLAPDGPNPMLSKLQPASKTVTNLASLNCTGHAGNECIKYHAFETLHKDGPPCFVDAGLDVRLDVKPWGSLPTSQAQKPPCSTPNASPPPPPSSLTPSANEPIPSSLTGPSTLPLKRDPSARVYSVVLCTSITP